MSMTSVLNVKVMWIMKLEPLVVKVNDVLVPLMSTWTWVMSGMEA